MIDDDDVAVIRRLIRAGLDAGPDPQHMKAALDYYYGRPRGDEMVGRSQIQSLDVADMTHAVLSQILPSFTQDTVCQFEPDGPNDEAMARLESDATNKVLMESSRGFVVFYEAMKDALLLKNGIVKVYLEETDAGRRVRCTAVDPNAFVVGAEQDCVLLDGYRTSLCGERKTYTRGELVDMGFSRDKVSEIPPGEDGMEDMNAQARYRQGVKPPDPQAGWALESVTIWEVYVRLPDDEDSAKVSLYRCLLGGQVLLLKERTDYVPYAAGTGFVEPHRFWGLSLYDRLKSVQDAKTAIQRQWLDNLANCNNSRTAYNIDTVNGDDLKSGRPGGLVQVRGPVADSLLPLPVIDAGPAAQAYLAYMDQVRADRGGAALQMASAEGQLAQGQIGSMGVDRIYSVQEALSGMIARTLAETLFRSAFMLVHRLLRTELAEPLTLRMADQWVQVDPSQWKYRDRVNIRSGLSPGERARKAQAMTLVLQMQNTALQMGMDGVMVTLPNIYNAYLDWASANELDAGEKYFTDPRSQTAQAGSQQKAQQGEQQQALMLQMEQAKLQLEQAKIQLDAQKAQMEQQFKYWEARLNAEVEEAKLIGGATAELNRVELEGLYALATAERGADRAGAGGGASTQ